MRSERGGKQPFDKAIALRTTHPCRAVHDFFQLQNEFEQMWAASAFPVGVAEGGFYALAVLFEERQHIVSEHVDGGKWQLAPTQAYQ